MQRFIDPEVEGYAERYTPKGPELLDELEKETIATMELPQMLSGHLSGRFLKMLCLINQPKTILEIGTYVGYSALCMAETLPEDGRLITCDINETYTKLAKKYFAKSPHGHKIELKMGPAVDTINALDCEIDLAFIDADKESYKQNYELVLTKLKRGGIIAIDNCLWSGRVVRPSSEEDLAIHELNELIQRDERVENVIVTVRDGINVVCKK
ncbi:MAG: class I SAM-dependent methyltransferase [Oligoflexales bacterium]|nr:class I SAM-dependent methyltransferase [Oligoflexales bacterium]